MKRLDNALYSTSLFLCLIGCGVEPEDDALPGSNGMQVCGVTGDAAGNLYMPAAAPNNYHFVSELDISEIPVAPQTELMFDWSAVTVDFVGHQLDPLTDIDMLALIVWKLNAQELAVRLNNDDLSQADFEAIAMVYNEDQFTTGNLFSFTEFGVEIDQELLLQYLDPNVFNPDEHAYTAMATTGTTPGKGTRMIQAFRLDPTSTNTVVPLHPESATLSYEVDLTGVAPVEVPANNPSITIDWSEIQFNALGAPFDPTSITEVKVGRFSLTVQELEDRFLDLDLIAEQQQEMGQIYRGAVLEGSSFSLAETVSDNGAPFPGVDGNGTWMVALMCETCTNPAPWFMTVLQPCDPQAQQQQTAQQAGGAAPSTGP